MEMVNRMNKKSCQKTMQLAGKGWSDVKTIKDEMQNLNLNIAVNDRVWPDFDVGRLSNWGMGYMPLKRLPLGWCGMKHESYILYAESLRLVWGETWKLYLTCWIP